MSPPPPLPRPDDPRGQAFSPGQRGIARVAQFVRARPYLAASLALHALVAGLWWQMPALAETERAMQAAEQARQEARQIAETGARELARRVERMADIQRRLAEAAGTASAEAAASAPADASPAALATRAQALATAIDAAERRLQAAALSRMTGMTLADALRELDARAARAPAAPPSAASPARTIERLEQHAREVLRTQRAQVAAARDGVRVTRAGASAPGLPTRAEIAAAAAAARAASAPPAPGGTAQARPADGIPRSAVDQMASVLRTGPAQGRVGVIGSEGGRSINREAFRGVAGGRIARADDPTPAGRFGDGAPVTIPGSSFDLTGKGLSTAGSGSAGHDLVRFLRPPAIDAALLRSGAGRSFGPGGAYATRIYLDSWYVIGPFPGGGGEHAMATAFPPEEDVDLDAAYRGLGGRLVRWTYASRGFYPFVLPAAADDAVYYAWTELRLAEGRDLWLAVAADDDSMLWIDGRLAWTSEPGDKPWYHPPFYLRDEQVASLALAEGHRKVHLEAGRHQLLVKLFNDRDRSFFSVVVAP